MFGNGVRDLERFAIRQRIVPAHRSLQFRKLANHAAYQIALRQQRSAFGSTCVNTQLCGNLHRYRSDARTAFRQRAEPALINNIAQRCAA